MYKWCSFNAIILSIENGASVPEVCGFDLIHSANTARREQRFNTSLETYFKAFSLAFCSL